MSKEAKNNNALKVSQVIDTKETLHQLLNSRNPEAKGRIILYSGHYEKATHQEHPYAIIVFGDNAKRVDERLEALKDEAEKQLKKAGKKNPTNREIRTKADLLLLEGNEKGNTRHTGGGQADMLGGKFFGHYYPNTLGVVTCDYKNEDAAKMRIDHAFYILQQYRDNKQCRNDKEYYFDIVIPVQKGSVTTSMGSGRAMKEGRQSSDFRGEAVVNYIQQKIEALIAGKMMDNPYVAPAVISQITVPAAAGSSSQSSAQSQQLANHTAVNNTEAVKDLFAFSSASSASNNEEVPVPAAVGGSGACRDSWSWSSRSSSGQLMGSGNRGK